MGVGFIILLSWERSKSVYSFCLLAPAILMVWSTSTPLQVLILINGNKMISQNVSKGFIVSRSLIFVQGISIQDCEACRMGIFLLPILPLSSAPSPLAGLVYGLICGDYAEADQCLWFLYMDSTIPLISSL